MLLAQLVTEYVADLSDLMEGSKKAQELIDGFGGLTEGPSKLADSFTDAGEKASSFADWVNAVIDTASELAPVLEEAGSGGTEALVSLEAETERLTEQLASTSRMAEFLSSKLATDAVAAADEFSAKIAQLGANIGGFFSSKLDQAGSKLSDFGAKIAQLGIAMNGFASDKLNQANSALSLFGSKVLAVVQPVLTFASQTQTNIGNAIDFVVMKLQQGATSAVMWGNNLITTGIDTASSFASNVQGKITSALDILTSKFLEAVDPAIQFGQRVQQSISDAADRISSKLDQAQNAVSSFVSRVTTPVSEFASNVKDKFEQAGLVVLGFGIKAGQGMSNAASAIRERLQPAIDKVEAFASRVREAAQPAVEFGQKILSSIPSLSSFVNWMKEGIQASQELASKEEQAANAASGIGKKAEEANGGLSSMLHNMLSFVAGQVVFSAVSGAVNFLKDQLSDTIKVAENHQAIMQQTTDAIKSTGDASGMSAQSIQDLAASLEKTTYFSKDQTQAGENLLLTFTGISKDVFPATTRTMLDMSKAMGMDTKSAAIQLGKALNDPLTGMAALTREGVTFSDTEKKSIQTMMAHNDIAGAQKVMLKELQTEFGGSSDATNTFAGKMTILSNSFNDVKEHIGDALIPILGNLADFASSKVVPALDNVGQFLASPAFQSFATGVGQGLVNIFAKIGTIVSQHVVPFLKDVGEKLQSPGFKAFASSIGKNISDIFQTIGNIGQNVVEPAIKGVVDTISSPQFGTFATNVGNIADQISSGLQPAISNVKPIIENLFSFVQNVAVPAASGVADGLGKVIKWFRDGSAPAQALGYALGLVALAFTAMKIGEFVVSMGQFITTLPGLIGGVWAWAGAQGAVALETLIAAAPFILIGAIVLGIVGLIILAITHWGDIMHWIQEAAGNVWKFISDKWGDAVGFFKGIGDGIGNIFNNAWNGVINGVKSAINWVIDRINDFISGLDKINVAGIGVNIALIPHLASGTGNFAGGMALVGENGPELVNLPRGASVLNAMDTASLMSAGSNMKAPDLPVMSTAKASRGSSSEATYEIHNHIYLDGNEIADNVMTRVHKQSRRGPIRSAA